MLGVVVVVWASIPVSDIYGILDTYVTCILYTSITKSKLLLSLGKKQRNQYALGLIPLNEQITLEHVIMS